MLFMLKIEVNLPADMPQMKKDELRKQENERAIELMKKEKYRRIWRIVGQTASYSVWEADTLEEMHANIGSMPLYPYMKVEVTPLVAHPAMDEWKSRYGDLPAF